MTHKRMTGTFTYDDLNGDFEVTVVEELIEQPVTETEHAAAIGPYATGGEYRVTMTKELVLRSEAANYDDVQWWVRELISGERAGGYEADEDGAYVYFVTVFQRFVGDGGAWYGYAQVGSATTGLPDGTWRAVWEEAGDRELLKSCGHGHPDAQAAYQCVAIKVHEDRLEAYEAGKEQQA
jgi:hypothetical protein